MKIFFAVLATALIVGLGVTAYFKGWFPTISFQKPQAVSTVKETQVVENPNLNAIATATPTPVSKTVVKAGGVLAFKIYSLEVPEGWTILKEGPSGGVEKDKLTLAKGAYKIVIYQAAFGGGGCTYPGDAALPMSVSFNAFTEVTTASGQKLRVGVLPSGGRAVCEFQSGAYGDITEFGHIDIANPSTPTQDMLDEINMILASLKII